MKKRVIILTKSDKHCHYCVAGIEFDSGRLVRLGRWIKNDMGSDKSFVLTKDDLGDIKILDIVDVEYLAEDVGIFHQPENVLINVDSLKKVGNIESWDFITLRWPELIQPKNRILAVPAVGDTHKACVSVEFRKKLQAHQRSLQLIQAKDVIIDYSEGKRHPKIKFNYINYEGINLKCEVTLTDPKFNRENKRNIDKINNAYILMSLGEEYYGKFYLLASELVAID